MRKDMIKVLTERPRAGGRRDYKSLRRTGKHVWRSDEDASGGLQGMRRPHKEHGEWKEFTDLLGPLHKFLKSRVGKPWDKVFAEIAGTIKGKSTQSDHLREHVKRMVVTDLAWEDGKLVHANGTEFKVFGHYREFYVDPRDKILKVVTEKQRRKWRDAKTVIKEQEDELKTKEGQLFRRFDGIWYEVTVVTEEVQVTVGNSTKWVEQHRKVARQLGTAELKQRGLSNEQPD